MKQTKKPGEKIINYYSIIKSPIDDLLLVADDSALVGLYFAGHDHIPAASQRWQRKDQHPALRQAAGELQEYFAGQRTEFSLPLRLAGTDFQEKVWREIARITYGETISYRDLTRP